MPLDHGQDPPGFGSQRHLNLFDRIIFGIAQVFGAVLAGAGAAAQTLINALRHEALDLNPNDVLSPDACATGVVKNADPQADWAGEARLSGISAERFRQLVALTGNPPGPETLVEGRRRQFIGDADMDHGLRQGYLKDEWVPFYHLMLAAQLTPDLIVNAQVQGHLSEVEAGVLLEGWGFDAGQHAVMFATAGNPPGPMQVLDLGRRGVFDNAEVDQALRESHLKDKYIDQFKALSVRYPPLFQLSRLLAAGTITDQVATDILHKQGYPQELVDAIVKAGSKVKPAVHKEETLAQVQSLYEDRIIDRATAIGDLAKIGWDATEAGELLDLADAKVEQKFRNAAISRIHALLVGRRITEAQAIGHLDAIHLAALQRDHLIELWKLEAAANVKVLTIGQLNSGYKKGQITLDEFVTRAVQMGYSKADAELLAEIDIPPSDPTTHNPIGPAGGHGSQYSQGA